MQAPTNDDKKLKKKMQGSGGVVNKFEIITKDDYMQAGTIDGIVHWLLDHVEYPPPQESKGSLLPLLNYPTFYQPLLCCFSHSLFEQHSHI